jgi:hypothetical protein
VQREQHALVYFEHHVDQLLLCKLEGGDGLSELDAVL